MSAIELVKILLGMGALFTGIFGIFMAFDVEAFDTKGNTLLIVAGIALLVMFHI